MHDSVATPGQAGAAFARGALTWHLYLLAGFFQLIINLQGNILPFLKAELDLSYRTVGLHPSAFACGITLVGLFGPRAVGAFGRRRMLVVGVWGTAAAVTLLCLAPGAPVSLASFALLGVFAAFIPTVVYASLADLHGERTPVAFNEAAATAAIFGIGAPLLTGLCIYLGLGWRSASLVGIAYGLLVVASLARVAAPEAGAAVAPTERSLPLAYWVYWTALAFGIATEFCILLWAPTYLEGVVGLSVGSAATAAVAFVLAMALGRVAGSRVVRSVGVARLLVSAACIALVGFGLYWGRGPAPVALLGLFVLGLGVSLFYPLVFGAAMEAIAPDQRDTASARTAIAAGVAVLTMPVLLGELAGRVGLHAAHLLVPTLGVVTLAVFMAGRRLSSAP